MKTILPIFLMSVLFGGVVAQAGEAVDLHGVDWTGDLVPGSRMVRTNENFRVALSDVSESLAIVDASTTPANPFPGTVQALYVPSTAANPLWFRLHFRPFASVSRKGAIEMDLSPGSGTINLQVGFNEMEWVPSNAATYQVSKRYLPVVLESGKNILVQGKPAVEGSVGVIEPGQIYRVLIKWDLDASPAGFSVFVNGDQLLFRNGMEMVLPASADSVKYGINTFQISNGGAAQHEGEFFLGPIRAVSGPVDLSTADEPLFPRVDPAR